MRQIKRKWLVWAGLCVALCAWPVSGHGDKDIAAEFAPVFMQGLGEKPQYDYPMRFDFDGDWRGDNNWENADKFTDSKAYVYFSVSATATHYFIHYAVYHPRDYKGGSKKGALLSDLLRQGADIAGTRDPIGLLEEATLAHENDLEGCLVVVEKDGAELSRARVVYVETLSHNRFKKYVPQSEAKNDFEQVALSRQHPRLFVQPKGHGIEAYQEEGEKGASERKILVYEVGAKAGSPAQANEGVVNYELLPIAETL